MIATGFASERLRAFDAVEHRELARIRVGAGSPHAAFAGSTVYAGCPVADHPAGVDLATLSVTRQITIH